MGEEKKIRPVTARMIFVIGIIIICILCINFAVYLTIVDKDEKPTKEENVVVDTVALSENFQNIFDNKLNSQNYSIQSVSKKDTSKELVYTNYQLEEKKEGKYDVNINMPFININNTTADNINKEIQNLFYSKINDILVQINDTEIIYSVKYKAYVNDNILSLVISSNLKEGANPQRLIIKTYNYNLSSNETLNINQVLNYRTLNEKTVQNKINEVIKEAEQTASTYKELGYTKYLRDLKDDMYKVQNTSVFFLGEGKALYILYPYGNSRNTSEFDLLVL